MMIFNRRFALFARRFGSAKEDPNLQKVTDLSENKQLRDGLQMPFMSQADKDTLYEHNHMRKSTALYNLMTYLPNSFTKFLTKFVSDPKIHIQSDNLYLPRLTKNGVPVYDSFRSANLAILIRNFELMIPLMFMLTVHYPGIMLVCGAIGYGVLYRPVFEGFTNGFVLKMELAPETEQIIIQKVGRFGIIKTSRINIDDIEISSRDQLNTFLYNSTKSLIDRNMIFKVKSTGEMLFFDPQGVWYEEGINHELLI